MNKIMFEAPTGLWADIKMRLRKLEESIGKLPEEERGRLQSACTMRGLCCALLKDGLTARTDADLLLLLAGEYVRQGRPALNTSRTEPKPAESGKKKIGLAGWEERLKAKKP